METIELMFEVKEDESGGYCARSVGESIFTQGDTWAELQANVREAVRCHFEDGKAPERIHLRLVRDEVIAL